MNGSKLITAVIKLVFKALILRWSNRNTLLHATAAPSTEQQQRLVNKIRTLYSLEPFVLQQDKIIFSTPLDIMITRHPRTLQLFLQQNAPIVKESIKHQQNLIQRQHRDIVTYFTKHQPNTNVRNTQVTLGN